MPWVYSPHSGGKKIPEQVRRRTEQRLRAYAERRYAGRFTRLGIRFHGALCYVDADVGQDGAADPVHLCRLRFFGDENRWSMAFYTYSHDRYEPCVFGNGSDHGTPEDALDLTAMYFR